jgi:hypothetical protein
LERRARLSEIRDVREALIVVILDCASVAVSCLYVGVSRCSSRMLKLFDKILKTTTLTLWAHNIRSTQQTNAVNNLKARLTALETINATQATAFAIARATEELNEKSSQDEHKEIRLSNLEKSLSPMNKKQTK